MFDSFDSIEGDSVDWETELNMMLKQMVRSNPQGGFKLPIRTFIRIGATRPELVEVAF